MGIDGLDDIDYSEGGTEKSVETAKEAQEKKEKASKAMAGIARTRRDEKKALKDNDFLYKIIVDIIQKQEFDMLIPFITELLKANMPSNLILGGISLVYTDAVYIIRHNYLPGNQNALVYDQEKAKEFMINLDYIPTSEMIEFNDNNLNSSIKKRINEWIEDIISVISFDPSSIVSKRFLKSLNGENKKLVLNYITSVLTLFLLRLKIIIQKDKAFLYSEFILSEVINKLRSIELDEI